MEQIKEMIQELAQPQFYSIKDVAKMLNWAEKTTQELFNRSDFPSTNIGKEKKVERQALIEYFKVARKRGE